MQAKKFGLAGTGSNIELGKAGNRVFVDPSGIVEFRPPSASGLQRLRAASPDTDNDVVTKCYIELRNSLSVKGEIYDDSGSEAHNPASPATGDVYIVTESTTGYTVNNLYRWNGVAFEAIALREGMVIAATDFLMNGVKYYLADYSYLWDEDGVEWLAVRYGEETRRIKIARTSIQFNSSSEVNIGAILPANSRVIKTVVKPVTQFDGGAVLNIGTLADPDSIMDENEIDLAHQETYVGESAIYYGGMNQLVASYTAGGATSGAADIEVQFSIDVLPYGSVWYEPGSSWFVGEYPGGAKWYKTSYNSADPSGLASATWNRLGIASSGPLPTFSYNATTDKLTMANCAVASLNTTLAKAGLVNGAPMYSLVLDKPRDTIVTYKGEAVTMDGLPVTHNV